MNFLYFVIFEPVLFPTFVYMLWYVAIVHLFLLIPKPVLEYITSEILTLLGDDYDSGFRLDNQWRAS